MCRVDTFMHVVVECLLRVLFIFRSIKKTHQLIQYYDTTVILCLISKQHKTIAYDTYFFYLLGASFLVHNSL